jgi:hypothetical protein
MRRAERNGKNRWGEKTPRHVYQLDVILERFPEAKIVFMVRDPRAVAVSYSHWKYQGHVGSDEAQMEAERMRAARSYHPLIISFMWRSSVRTYRSVRERFGDQRIHMVRYEDLVTGPETALRDLCAFLDETYTEKMLEVPVGNSSFAEYNRKGGIDAGSLDRWRDQLSPAEIATIQRFCRPEMTVCGYAPEPVGTQAVGVAGRWLSLPFAVVRATLANRSRIGSLPAYLWRRLRGVSCTD